MITKDEATKQKIYGAYDTPEEFADALLRSIPGKFQSILEPSFGHGIFLDTVIRNERLDENGKITGVEIDPEKAAEVERKYQDKEDVEVFCEDFLGVYEKHKDDRYDLIIGNPPYIRYQYLSKEQKDIMTDILVSHGMRSNRLVNAWVGFVIAGIHMLKEDGTIAFILPTNLLNVSYAKELRQFLVKSLSGVTLITFKNKVFTGIEQDVVVLIGTKDQEETGLRHVELNRPDELSLFPFYPFQEMTQEDEKWTHLFLSPDQKRLVETVKSDERFVRMSDVVTTQIGTTTGCNRFFCIPKMTVSKYDLWDYIRPIVGKGKDLHQILFRKEDWEILSGKGQPVYLFYPPDVPFEELPKDCQKYIRMGEYERVNGKPKCKDRKVWYRCPSVNSSKFFLMRMIGDHPKMLLNLYDAVPTDAIIRLRIKGEIEPERVLFGFYSSVSFAFAELCGNVHGGGLLELTPGDIRNIRTPKTDHIPITTIKELLSQMDQMVRNGEEIEKVLDVVDEQLIQYEGLDEKSCKDFRNLWEGMRKRRTKK